MNDRRWWIGIVGGGTALAMACGGLVYWQYGVIEKAREEVTGVRAEIESSRKLLTGTPKMEREVIVLRETEEVIKEILPDQEDLNNFVRDLRSFEQDSGVRITGLKKVDDRRPANAKQTSFEPVTYTLTLEGDAFEYMAFLDYLEGHRRFMRVPNFKLASASRKDIEDEGTPSHKIQMDVETYAYAPDAGPAPVKIEGYLRKRELLIGEIKATRDALKVKDYEYRGHRGRRDPWVDPRVPRDVADDILTVEEQIALVEDLVQRMKELQEAWDVYEDAGNVIEEMTMRAEVESLMADIESDVLRIEEEHAIRYVPSSRRLQLEVVQPLSDMRTVLAEQGEIDQGPTLENLIDIQANMEEHMGVGEFDLALKTFQGIELRLDYVRGDQERWAIAERLRTMALQSRVASEFQKLDLDISGRALMENAEPVVLIGGRTMREGDLLSNDLIIRTIREDEVEFIFRGVVLVRRL